MIGSNMHYNIVEDSQPTSPREFDNLGKILYTSNRHILGDENVSSEKIQYIIDSKDYIHLPVYAYIHGSIVLNTTGFSCPWDSGMSGIIYVSKNKVREDFKKKLISNKLYNTVLDILKSEVDVFSKYLNGEVYGYEILNDKEEIIDSCYGYYGFEEAEIAAKETMTYHKKSVA